MKMVSALFLTMCSTSLGSHGGDGQDGIDVVDLGAADDRLVVVVGDSHGQLLVRDGWKAGRMKVWMKARGRVGLAEVDLFGRCEEVADDETGEQLDQPGALAAWQVAVDQRGEEHGGHADDARQPVDRELAERVAGLAGQHQRQVLVAAQLVGGVHDAAHQQVLEVDGAVEVGAQPGEEVLELAHPQRLEQHVLAAGEHPVQRRPRHAGLVWRCLRW